MQRVAFILLLMLLAASASVDAQTYTYIDLGTAPYSDTFGASAYNDNQVGYGLVNGQPQALLWQSTAASATPLPSTISQPVGPAAANIVVVGDSITAGVDGFPQNAAQGYPAVMQSLGMGQGGSLVYNLGMPGEKAGDMLGQYSGATGTTSVTTTVTTSTSSTMATIGNATGVTMGMSIAGPGIPVNTTITAISGTTITLSNAATKNEIAASCSIATPVQDISVGTGYYPGGAANGWSNFMNTAHQLSYAVSGRPTYVMILAGTNDLYANGAVNGANGTSTAGQTTLTLSSGYSGMNNGDVLSGPNLPTNPLPCIVSGGGTNTVTLSAPATSSGSFLVTDWYPTTVLATLEANYTSLVAAAHADGDTVANGGGVVAMTILPRGNSTDYTDMAINVLIGEFNAWLKSGGSGADYVFDTNSALPPFGPATSSSYYFSDQLHLSTQGTSVLGNYINQQFFAQVDTSATSYASTEANGIYSTFAAGNGITPQGQSVGLLWNGLTQPPVNLNPSFASSSVVNGIGASLGTLCEVGTANLTSTGQQVAVCWSGTASSAVNLNPYGATSSQAFASVGTQAQAGSAVFSGVTHAMVWGSLPGTVDLNPTGALRSEALGIAYYFLNSGIAPAEVGEVGDYTTSAGAVHACVWSSTAASMVDLHPASGYTMSTATGATSGLISSSYTGTVVGYATNSSGTIVPVLWAVTSSTKAMTDLSSYLPVGTTSSRALAIDVLDNSILGTVVVNGSNHAFLLRPSASPTFRTPPQNLSTIVNLPYTYNVVAGGFPVPTYSTTGNLPPGLNISATTGVISGTPTQTGTYAGTIAATNTINGTQHTTTQPFSIKVVAAPAFSQVNIVASLAPANGTGLHQSMVLGPDGNFYGTCSTGGVLNNGTVFKMTPAGVETTVHAFADGSIANDGAQPEGLSFGSDGSLYGTTYAGGTAGLGTVFNITSGTTTILHNFGDGSVSQDGANPATAMLQATNGSFYGVTKNGGSASQGTMFSITPFGALSVLTNFSGTMGESPDNPLIQDPRFPATLILYGSTLTGGVEVRGTAFQAGTSGLSAIIKQFDATIPPILGDRPHGAMTLGSDGSLYGIATAGGASYPYNNSTSDPATFGVWGIGTIFKMSSSGTQTDIHNFGDGTVGNDGANTTDQTAPLVQGPDGNFYGVTPAGGSTNQGCLFQITPSGTMIVLHSFGDGTLPNDGTEPGPVFFLGPDGYTFYGITEKGGAYGNGAIYKFNIGMAPTFSANGINLQGNVSAPFSYTVGAAGYPTPTYSVTSGSLPPGLSLSSNGVISGTPTAKGETTAVVAAGNGVGIGATQNITINVVSAPVITNGPLSANIPIGAAYNFNYTAIGSPQPTFSITAGALPPGLSLSSAGAISGTPTTMGFYTGTVDATNGTSPDATQGFSISVLNTFTNWESQYFTTQQLGMPSVSGPNADPGNDGVPNLLKYLFDINPSVTIGTADRAALPQVAVTTVNSVNYLTLTYRQNTLAGGITVNLQTSTDLVNWTTVTPDLNTSTPISGTNDATVQVGVKMTTARAEYIRLNVTSP